MNKIISDSLAKNHLPIIISNPKRNENYFWRIDIRLGWDEGRRWEIEKDGKTMKMRLTFSKLLERIGEDKVEIKKITKRRFFVFVNSIGEKYLGNTIHGEGSKYYDDSEWDKEMTEKEISLLKEFGISYP